MALREKNALDTMNLMNEKLMLGWNRFGILGSQIALVAMLFFYGFAPLSDRLLFPFLVSLLLAYAHHQWVQAAMFPLIDHATNHGHFKVLARLAWLHQDFVVIGSALLIGVWAMFLWIVGSLEVLVLGAVILVLAGLNGSWKATLRFHASSYHPSSGGPPPNCLDCWGCRGVVVYRRSMVCDLFIWSSHRRLVALCHKASSGSHSALQGTPVPQKL
jgi:hypothetical protein